MSVYRTPCPPPKVEPPPVPKRDWFVVAFFKDWFNWKDWVEGEAVWRAWWTVAILNSIYFFASMALGHAPYGGR